MFRLIIKLPNNAMLRFPVFSRLPGYGPSRPGSGVLPRLHRVVDFLRGWWLPVWLVCCVARPAAAVILWNDPGTTLVHDNGAGTDILGGAVKRDDSANDTLYFKFHVDPLSDKDTEQYFAGFELYEGDTERLGIGNSLTAWAYSAFFHADETGDSNNPSGYFDLHTSKPESPASASYQYPRHGVGATIVFKVQFVPGEDDLVTVWLNPDLGPGANEAYQPDSLTTRFNANASFDEIRLRHGGRGGGWLFSDLAIATAFSDFVDASGARPNDTAASAIGGLWAINFRAWEKEQGLPQSLVRALAQTQDGYIWIGGDDGLARFDGLRFVPFGSQEGIKCGPVSVLLADHDGALWIGSTRGGLSCLRNNKLTTLTTKDGLPGDSITALAEDAAGRLWIGTEAGLALWQNGRITPLPAAATLNGRAITGLAKDRQGTMWIGAKGAGIFQYRNDTCVPLAGDSPAELLKDSHCLFVDQTGRLWIGAGDDFILCHEGDHWQRYRIPRSRVKSYVNTLAGEPDGTLWAGTGAGGLLQFKEGKLFAVPAGTGLAGNSVESLLTDHEGRLWVGTDTGLNRLQRKSLFALSQDEGLGFGAAQGLAEVTPGVVWVGKPNDGLYRWDGRSFSRLSTAGLLPHDSQITTLLVTRDGFCWVATAKSLLLYEDSVAVADEVKTIASAPPGITALAEDREGALWVGTREGKIRRLSGSGWQDPAGFFQTNAITAIVPDVDGSLWVGTDGNGLYRFSHGNFIRIGKSEGLLSDAIRTLYLDAGGALWIGTADSGLSRWQGGRVANFTPREGLPDGTISQILEDDSDRLWLGTSRGIACVSKLRLNEVAAGKIPAVYPKLFGLADGMLSAECSSGFFPAGLKTKSGLLWFSTLKGVAVVDPRAQPNNVLPPNTMLEEILVDGLPESPAPAAATKDADENNGPQPEMLRITPGKHRVEFHYTGLSFDAPELIRFRYRLDGLDSDWEDAGTRRTALYNYLPPGDYRFHVAACNADGIWSENGPGLELIVLRHFWETWWFLTLAGLTLMVSVGGAVRLVVKRKLQRRLKHLEQERALERERRRIAQDLHDEMGAKLCRISFLSEHARRGELPPHELQDQITSISDASREVLHSLDEIVWAVNPQNDTLEHVASYIGQYAQEYFQMTGIQCELDIPAQVPPYPLSSQTRHHLFLAAHEALTNILKHSGASQTKVRMVLMDTAFTINIADNGRGFDLSAQEAKLASAATPAGDGLINMRRRLQDIGGQYRIESVPGQGTTVTFVIPLNFLVKPV
jgi:ligand-binding sensor domain-containing protein/signal transduction histidine kinase